MHPNQSFRKADRATNVAFARSRGFGILAINAEPSPLLAHIPFVLSKDGNWLEAHLVRSNPVLRLLETPQPAVLAVSGDDAYISPDWYGVKDQVPTWNYVAVHLRGMLEKLPDERLHECLVRLSHEMETRLLPKPPWKTDKMDEAVYTGMQRQIVPVGMKVETIEGTWKLSQNKPDNVRVSAANALRKVEENAAPERISGLMERNQV